MAEAGFLATNGADPAEYSRRSALYVQKILNGGKPGDMPVELPTKFELLLNLRTAKTLGLRLPTSLLQRADELIE